MSEQEGPAEVPVESGATSPIDVAGQLEGVRAALRRAAKDGGRDPSGITLVAVSKLIGPGPIETALRGGQRVFGENYVQESAAKWPALREGWRDVELHLVGPLQSNKARDAVRLFDVVQSLDRPSLAKALAKAVQEIGRAPRLFVQVNTGAEPQKAGVLPDDVDGFLQSCRRDYALPVEGLMCIPPADDPPSAHFGLLRVLAERNGLPRLSMGMSADFEAAIQVGASHVRVGTAIFGQRPSPVL